LSFCSGWIADGLIVNGTAAGGSVQGAQLIELGHGEKITIIEGSRVGFENRVVVGRLKLTSSAGRTFGNVFPYWLPTLIFIIQNIYRVIIKTPLYRPFGHNGNPSTSPNENRVYSRFRFQRDEGITQINTLVSEFMTYPYTHTKKFLMDVLSVE